MARAYPGFKDQGQGGGNPNDKQNFAYLIKELHYAFQPKGYVLSASVSANKTRIDVSYDVFTLSKYLDFINLITYDFHGAFVERTAPNAPLHPKPGATGIDMIYTVEYAVNYWLMKGADPRKIVKILFLNIFLT